MVRHNWLKEENTYTLQSLQLKVVGETAILEKDGLEISKFRLFGEVNLDYCKEYAEQQLEIKVKNKNEAVKI